MTILSVVQVGRVTATKEGDIASRLDAFFTDLHQRDLFDGAVVVSHRNRIIWEKGFGYADAAQMVPFTPRTPTDAASLAKTFTSALLIMLEHDGVLRLDDPAQRFLPELPYRDITLRHLLSHTSGLPVHGYEYFDQFIPSDRLRTTEALLSVLATQRPLLTSRPGTSFEYSSFGYDLAALAAARATGRSYEDLLKERVFIPLGLVSAFVRPGRLRDFPKVRTLAYRRVAGKLVLHDVFDFEGFHGGSNIYISAQDLHRWNAVFFNSLLFSRDELEQLLSVARVADRPSGLTLGSWYRTADGSAFWYSGHLEGFHTEVFRDMRRQLSIVYTSNNTIEPWLQKGLIRAMCRITIGKNPELAAPATEPVARDERRLLEGRWVLQDGHVITIESTDSLAVVQNGVKYAMFPEGGMRAFYVPGLDLIVGFARGPDHSISKIHISSTIGDEWGSRAAH